MRALTPRSVSHLLGPFGAGTETILTDWKNNTSLAVIQGRYEIDVFPVCGLLRCNLRRSYLLISVLC